jgi:hypothetical protein
LEGLGAVVVGIGTVGSAFFYSQVREAKERKEKDALLHGSPKALDTSKKQGMLMI